MRESKQRIRAALKNCGYDVPLTQITINLAPADIKKEGSGFDLPMAMGIVGAYGGLVKKGLPEFVMVGELSLDGGVRAVRGALPIAIAARANKIPNLIVPEANAREAAVVSGVNVYPVKSLIDVVNLLNTGNGITAGQGRCGRNAGQRRRIRWPTSKTCADSSPPSARWKFPAPVVITS